MLSKLTRRRKHKRAPNAKAIRKRSEGYRSIANKRHAYKKVLTREEQQKVENLVRIISHSRNSAQVYEAAEQLVEVSQKQRLKYAE